MLSKYAAVYLEINLIGILLVLLILFKMRRENDRQMANRSFMNVACAVLAILFTDAVWVLLDGNPSPGLVVVNYAVNILYLFFTGLIPYLWIQFVLYKLKKHLSMKAWQKALLAAPLLALLALCIASPWTHWLFQIEAGNVYRRGPLHFLQQLIGCGYGVGVGLYTLWIARREKSPEIRADALTLSSFSVLPLLGSIVNAFTFGIPVIWPLTALSLNIVYIGLLGRQITTDSLTGLNNRCLFDRYLRSALSDRRRDGLLYLLLLDVDDFKRINDTYGHTTGDQALAETAGVLKEVCGARNAFLARYGGDEFAIILEAQKPEELESLKAELDEAFLSFNRRIARPYRLQISAGASRYYAEASTPASMVEQADQALYDCKAAKRQGRLGNRKRLL